MIDVDLIEQLIVDAIERVVADLSDVIGVDFAAEARAALKPYIRSTAEALTASLAAGETPEQFAERLDALQIQRPTEES